MIPDYYTNLAPFEELFGTGLPVLTYHKVGPRPFNVRLKGMYMAPSLFDRQLAELRGAGFASTSLGGVVGRDGNPDRRIAITFDDGFANVLQNAAEPLARHRYKAIEFLVAYRIGQFNEWEIREGEAREPLMDMAQIKDWLAAGHEVGSHTLTHPMLTQISPEQAREEIFDSKKSLEDLFGVPIRHFCYPYGDWNPALRDLVREAGYQTASTTNPGVNHAAVSPFELKRMTARHQTRSLKALTARFFGTGVFA